MKRTKIGAIDVGTFKVCTIIADIDSDNGLRILGVGVAPSQGLQKGMVENVNEAKESISKSVKEAERIAGCKLESAYIGITGRHISSVNNHGVVAITRSDQLVRPEDLKRVLQIASNIEVPSEQRLLHVIPRTYMVDGQQGVKNPVGMHGFRLDVEAHIITGAIASLQNLTKSIRSVGIDIDDIVIGPLASAEAVITEDERRTGVMLADIGDGTTDIAIFKDDSVYHTSVLPAAGHSITRDISIIMGLSFELSEEMKKKFGSMKLTPSEEDEDGKIVKIDGHSISYRDLSAIIHIRVEELLRLIVMELPQNDIAKLIPSGLVLTGGTANLPGIVEFGRELTQLPVRIGKPINLYGISETLNNPGYAASIGLLLWKMRNKDIQSWQSKNILHYFTRQILRLFH